MQNRITREDVLRNYSSDQELDALDNEIKLFFSNNPKLSVTRIGKAVYIETDNKKVCLRGDNLITRKQMYRRSACHDQVENDNSLCAFMLIPHIENMERCQLNSKRASIAGYDDNPFIFLSALEKMCRKKEYDIPDKDKVEEWIAYNRDYWDCFYNGFDDFLYVNCLKCFRTLVTDKKYQNYKKFFTKRSVLEAWSKEDMSCYEDLLTEFKRLREKEMLQRVNQ